MSTELRTIAGLQTAENPMEYSLNAWSKAGDTGGKNSVKPQAWSQHNTNMLVLAQGELAKPKIRRK